MKVAVTTHGGNLICIRFEEPPSMEWAMVIESHLRSRVPAVNELAAWTNGGLLAFFSLNASRVPAPGVLLRDVESALAELPD